MEDIFHEFTVLISSINRCIYRIKSEKKQDFSLKIFHVNCLYYIYKHHYLTPKLLYKILKKQTNFNQDNIVNLIERNLKMVLDR